MKVCWEVDDGYVGKSRPQYTEIDDREIAECETVEEAIELVYDYVQHDFEQRILWCCDPDTDEIERILKENKEED